MLASGYLKVISSEELNLIRESDNEYELAITNREILFMFKNDTQMVYTGKAGNK